LILTDTFSAKPHFYIPIIHAIQIVGLHKLELFALKKIKAGEEMFWDYSTSMLERHWTMECSCREKNCRKVLADFDLLPKHVQEKYLTLNIAFPFIAHFINYQRAKSV
jgi:hypothetical protein